MNSTSSWGVEHLKKRRVVVWYDPKEEFRPASGNSDVEVTRRTAGRTRFESVKYQHGSANSKGPPPKRSSRSNR